MCTGQLVGFTPDDVAPIDAAGIINLTWAHLTGATVLGQPAGIDFGQFTAMSIYNTERMVCYTSRTIKNAGFGASTIADNVGNTRGPVSTSVPEPGSLGMLGMGWQHLSLRGAESPAFKFKPDIAAKGCAAIGNCNDRRRCGAYPLTSRKHTAFSSSSTGHAACMGGYTRRFG